MQTCIKKAQINNFLGTLQTLIFITDSHKGLAWGLRNELDIGLVEDVNVRHSIILVKYVYGIE